MGASGRGHRHRLLTTPPSTAASPGSTRHRSTGGAGRRSRRLGVRTRRDDVTILTKCGTVRQADGSWAEDGRPAAVRTISRASSACARITWTCSSSIDPDPSVPVRGDRRRDGGARSTAGKRPPHRAVQPSRRSPGTGARRPTTGRRAGPVVDPPSPARDRAVRRWCATAGVAFLARCAAGLGLLVDGFDPEADGAERPPPSCGGLRVTGPERSKRSGPKADLRGRSSTTRGMLSPWLRDGPSDRGRPSLQPRLRTSARCRRPSPPASSPRRCLSRDRRGQHDVGRTVVATHLVTFEERPASPWAAPSTTTLSWAPRRDGSRGVMISSGRRAATASRSSSR